jgi:Polyketide cyclase / dehydrase and lipid transport
MSRNEIVIEAPAGEVLAVLLDAECYGEWVVGSKELRGVEPDWPQPGSRFHHSQGAGPLTLDDDTKMVERSDRRLVLDVHYRPVGTALVTLSLAERPDGRATRVTMEEEPTSGITAKLPRPLVDPLFGVRNRMSLRRLAKLVVGRHHSDTASSN